MAHIKMQRADIARLNVYSHVPIPAVQRMPVRAQVAKQMPVLAAMALTKPKIGVSTLTASRFQEFLAENKDRLMVVDYFTPLCGPCKFMAPVFDEMAAEFDDVAFAKLDCHEPGNEPVVASAGVRALPTFHLYRSTDHGTAQLLAEVTGAKAKDLKRLICKYRKARAAKPGDGYWY